MTVGHREKNKVKGPNCLSRVSPLLTLLPFSVSPHSHPTVVSPFNQSNHNDKYGGWSEMSDDHHDRMV